MRVIFMRLGIAKIHEKPIPEQLGDMPIVALNNFGTHPLVRTDHVSILFGSNCPESLVESTRSQNMTVS